MIRQVFNLFTYLLTKLFSFNHQFTFNDFGLKFISPIIILIFKISFFNFLVLMN